MLVLSLVNPLPFLLFSLHPSDLISLLLSIRIYLKTPDKPMELPPMLVCNILPNHGELVEPLLVFPEFQDQELTEPVKLPSVTCVEKVECSLLLKPTEDGIEKLMSTKEDMLLPQLWLLLLYILWFKPEDTDVLKFLNSH